MKTLLATFAAFVPAAAPVAAAAQSPDAGATLGRLASSAERDLAQSVQELDELRARIAAEKLPLAQELTGLEERLAQLRREHDRVARSADEDQLALATLQAEIDAERDELDYTGNLLDEYARAFESKIDVCELQALGEPRDAAVRAIEDGGLTLAERFDRQVAFVDVTIERLARLIGGMSFPGTGVDLQGAVLEGSFAILGPVALFRAANGAAGLAVPQSGSPLPLIRPLAGALQAGLAALVAGGDGLLPLDPSRGGALEELVQETNLIHIFEKGGPIMWPLLAASVLALGTVLERVIFLLNEKRKRDPKALEAFFGEVERGRPEAAVQIAAQTRDFVVRALGYALEHREQSLSNALVFAQARELKRFRRGVSILDTVITLAPLLGLLGTVTGMMGSFSLIGGDLGAPGAITGGIAEALIATAFGLGIAITALLPFNVLNTKLEEARHEIESAATQLELMVHPQAGLGTRAGHASSAVERPRQVLTPHALAVGVAAGKD
jgi:biopolymer transport protein ExbB